MIIFPGLQNQIWFQSKFWLTESMKDKQHTSSIQKNKHFSFKIQPKSTHIEWLGFGNGCFFELRQLQHFQPNRFHYIPNLYFWSLVKFYSYLLKYKLEKRDIVLLCQKSSFQKDQQCYLRISFTIKFNHET
jgi:hypothetical protein